MLDCFNPIKHGPFLGLDIFGKGLCGPCLDILAQEQQKYKMVGMLSNTFYGL